MGVYELLFDGKLYVEITQQSAPPKPKDEWFAGAYARGVSEIELRVKNGPVIWSGSNKKLGE